MSDREDAPGADRDRLRTRPGVQAMAAARALLHDSHSLMLATADGHGEPLASHAPYVIARGAMHVFVSRLAAHSANLARGVQMSAMVVEDAGAGRQPFARVRLVCRCLPVPVPRDGPDASPVLDAMQERFGAVVGTLRELPDFQLYRLVMLDASFVQGFGKAYALDDADLASLTAPAGLAP